MIENWGHGLFCFSYLSAMAMSLLLNFSRSVCYTLFLVSLVKNGGFHTHFMIRLFILFFNPVGCFCSYSIYPGYRVIYRLILNLLVKHD